MVKIRCIFQLIVAADFVAFYFTKAHNYFTLMLTKSLQLLGHPQGSAPGPCWGTCVPQTPYYVPPKPWRQIDAYAHMCLSKPRLHDTAGCSTGQPVVQPVEQPVV